MNTDGLALRCLQLQDMAQAAQVHRTAFDACLPWLKGLHTPSEDIWFYETLMFAQCEIWGAFIPNLVGIIAFKEDWIEQFYILPAFQRQGIGSALLKKPSKTTHYCNYGHFKKIKLHDLFMRSTTLPHLIKLTVKTMRKKNRICFISGSKQITLAQQFSSK